MGSPRRETTTHSFIEEMVENSTNPISMGGEGIKSAECRESRKVTAF